MIGFLDQII